MSKLIKINNDYASWIKHLSLRFRQSQIKAAVKVNREMLKFYFSLGADIVTKQAESKWGDGFFKNLSQDLQDALPGVKGFSETSLKYAKYFYLTYKEYVTNRPQVGDGLDSLQKMEISPQVEDEITPQIAAQIFSIPWGHHKLIIDKLKKNKLPDEVVVEILHWSSPDMVKIYNDTPQEEMLSQYLGKEGFKDIEPVSIKDIK